MPRNLFFFSVFLLCLFFSLGLCMVGKVGDHIITIAYLLGLMGLFIVSLSFPVGEDSDWKSDLKFLFGTAFSMLLGTLLGLQIGGADQGVIWLEDSIVSHLPVSMQFYNYLSGIGGLEDIRFEVPGVSVHLVIGFLFWVLGPGIVASIVGLFLFKLGTIVVIYNLGRYLHSERAAIYGALIYLFAPTVQFYTLTYYKEASVHFYLALVLYLACLIFGTRKYWLLVLFAGGLYLLGQERFYIVLLLPISLAVVLLDSILKRNIGALALAFLSLVALSFHHIYLQQGPEWILTKLIEFRESHKNYNDFSYRWNYEIPYTLAILKSYFTPFFTPNKMDLFTDFSNLLTFGSFLNQGVLLAALLSFYKSLKEDFFKHAVVILPFVGLIFLLAFISPWAGRIRDSFYPIVGIYAAHCILLYFLPYLKSIHYFDKLRAKF